jgi:hypothetical protein
MTFIQWVQDLFKDERGSTSIKPLVGFICTLVLCTVLCFKFTPDTTALNAVLLLAVVGIGADTVDKFSLKGLSKSEEPKQPENQ